MNDSYADGYELAFSLAVNAPDIPGGAIVTHPKQGSSPEYQRGFRDGELWGIRCRLAAKHKAQLAQNVIKEKTCVPENH